MKRSPWKPPRTPLLTRGLVLLLTLPLLILSGCARNPPARIVQQLAPVWVERSEIPATDLAVTVVWASPAERREMLQAPDPAAWIEHYWDLWDPSPGTEDNELLEVLRQRAEVLATRFPGTELADVPEPWITFFFEGLWDSLERRISGPDTLLQLVYQRGGPRRSSVRPGDLLRGTRRRETPQLDGAWSALTDADTPRADRIRALETISWYELPDLAVQLLTLPGEVAGTLAEAWDGRLLRMAHRMSVRLGTEGVRRIAALTALREPSAFILRKAALREYGAASFANDLTSARRRWQNPALQVVRNPHPRLWSDPEGLFAALAVRYPEPDSPTGWSWRGDVALALGPPAAWTRIDPAGRPSRTSARERSASGHDAFFLYGKAEILRIRQAHMGWVEAIPAGDLVSQMAGADPTHGVPRQEAELLSRTLGQVLERSEGAGGLTVTPELLSGLAALLPSAVYDVGLPDRSNVFPIQANAVVLPGRGGGQEIQLSMGVLVSDVEAERVGDHLKTGLMARCTLLDEGGLIIGEEQHVGGSVLEEWADADELPHLVDVYTFRTQAGRRTLYVSALDPTSGRSGGVVVFVPAHAEVGGSGPRLSDVVVAGEIGVAPRVPDQYSRGEYRVVPYPGRTLYYEEPMWIYYEIHDLARSEIGDYVWEELYYIVPERPGQGIVRIPSPDLSNTIRSPVQRALMLDLTSRRGAYEGPVMLVVVVRDRTSGEWGASAVKVTLVSRGRGD